jgi:hypothetical protein
MNTIEDNEEELTEEQEELKAIGEGLAEALDEDNRKGESNDEDEEADDSEDESPQEAASEEVAATEQVSEEQEVSPESDEAPVEDDVSYPGTWSADEREIFASLPPAAQEVVARRTAALQGDLTRESQKRAYLEKQLTPLQGHVQQMEQTVAPYRHRWKDSGVEDSVIIENLLKAQELIEQDPIEGIWHILDTTGLTPEDLYDEGGGKGGTRREADPELMRLHQRLDAQEAKEREAREQATTLQQQQQQQALANELNQFATEKDGQGNFIRPFLADANTQQKVAYAMARRIKDLREEEPWLSQRELLEQSYDDAVWANASTREILQKQNGTAKMASKKDDVQAKKRAASSLKGSQGQAPEVKKKVPDDLGKVIEMAMDGELL